MIVVYWCRILHEMLLRSALTLSDAVLKSYDLYLSVDSSQITGI